MSDRNKGRLYQRSWAIELKKFGENEARVRVKEYYPKQRAQNSQHPIPLHTGDLCGRPRIAIQKVLEIGFAKGYFNEQTVQSLVKWMLRRKYARPRHVSQAVIQFSGEEFLGRKRGDDDGENGV